MIFAGDWACFRGEDHDETHLSEFFHSEAEIPGDLESVMSTVDAYVRRLSAVLCDIPQLFDPLGGDLSHLVALAENQQIHRMSFDAAALELADTPGAVDSHQSGFRTLTRAGERELMRRLGGPVWVYEWDELAVPFYQASVERPAGRRARNADLLLGVGEVAGAGERHTIGGDVRAALDAHGVAPDAYEWYVQMKDTVPLATSGFGLGVERFLCFVFDHTDVRDFQLVPRLRGMRGMF